MEFPSEIAIPLLTRRGAIFQIADGELVQGEGQHSFIVCNSAHPEEIVILVCATSQLQRRVEYIEKRKLPNETLVHMGANEYQHFPKVTAFDCNTVFTIKLDQFIGLHRLGKVKYISGEQMRTEHMNKIEAGIKASPLISKSIHQLVDTQSK